jgi:hypothetical protein
MTPTAIGQTTGEARTFGGDVYIDRTGLEAITVTFATVEARQMVAPLFNKSEQAVLFKSDETGQVYADYKPLEQALTPSGWAAKPEQK